MRLSQFLLKFGALQTPATIRICISGRSAATTLSCSFPSKFQLPQLNSWDLPSAACGTIRISETCLSSSRRASAGSPAKRVWRSPKRWVTNRRISARCASTEFSPPARSRSVISRSCCSRSWIAATKKVDGSRFSSRSSQPPQFTFQLLLALAHLP